MIVIIVVLVSTKIHRRIHKTFLPYKCLSEIEKLTTDKMATITDLDEKCLTGIFHYLDKFDVFALRRMNSRFIGATDEESHPNLKKLHVSGGNNRSTATDNQIIEFIAKHLYDLVDLNIGRFSSNNSTLICDLSNLESLAIKIGADVKPFKNSKKLKYLKITDFPCISMQNLNDLVEFVPTLIRVKLNAEFATVFNKAVADGLVAKRLLSSHCDAERCELEYVLGIMDPDEYRAFVKSMDMWEEIDFAGLVESVNGSLWATNPDEMYDLES